MLSLWFSKVSESTAHIEQMAPPAGIDYKLHIPFIIRRANVFDNFRNFAVSEKSKTTECIQVNFVIWCRVVTAPNPIYVWRSKMEEKLLIAFPKLHPTTKDVNHLAERGYHMHLQNNTHKMTHKKIKMKHSCCVLESESLPELLCTGWFQERITAWFTIA